MPHDLPKAYDPTAIEDHWAEYWVREKLFAQPASAESKGGQPFDILLPPPNVTGRLHMGHMLNQTEMDILTRWHRMRGDRALWLPGTDHAGIATQMMVERQLATEGKKRQEMGREAFIERVWEWKRHYGGAILDQMKRLGASVDWDREYFTMDKRLSVAVREAFVKLYEQGLIYRGAYIVNWCPRCQTAISDLEVVYDEHKGHLWEIRYPVIGDDGKDTGEFLTVATTRPETMLGDVAVAIHPEDERYTHLHGKKLRLPLVGREIPIITDEWVSREFGTGAVKVTPAHDPNDFALGQRHNLPSINVMDDSAHINEQGGKYTGLDRFVARKEVVADLEAQGLLAGIKDHVNNIGHCDRCKTIVEPRLSLQWFIKIQPLADKAIAAVKEGHIKFTPEMYAKTYLNWMENIHDWCISRQLWWGHRIPAWHCQDAKCKHINVAREAPPKCAKCGDAALAQDTDVLDTWFSSGLLPFTVFGWPEKTKDLEIFYPTSLLVTGFDILFFWVARMIMLGCWFMGGEDRLDLSNPAHDAALAKSVPFKDVYIHALVRDADRQKMSKTKGNVIDPIEITERFGTDAVRFTLASQAAPGTDIAFNEDRTQGYRAFANKIWNAARFLFMQMERAKQSGAWPPPKDFACGTSALELRWIHGRFYSTIDAVNSALNEFRFDEAASFIYQFIWGDFCDWYIEIAKLRMNAGESKEERFITTRSLAWTCIIFEQTLRMLSPFMPFLSEELWHAFHEDGTPNRSIALSSYPSLLAVPTERESMFLKESGLPADFRSRAQEVSNMAERDMSALQALITDIRNLRAELKVEPKVRVPLEIHSSAEMRKLVEANQLIVERLAGVESIKFADGSLAQSTNVRVSPDYEVRVIFEQKVDPAAERDRLSKDLAKLEKEFGNNQRQLGNEQFLSKAPAHVVEGLRRREGELKVLIEKTNSALAALK